MRTEMTRDELVEYFIYWTIRRYGHEAVTRTDLRKVPSKKLYGAWRAVAFRGDTECGIIRTIIAERTSHTGRSLRPKSSRTRATHVSSRPDYKMLAANDHSED